MDNEIEKLEKLIVSWRKKLRKQDHLEDGVIEELEDHLRQSVEKYCADGLNVEDAFEKAISELGSPYDIDREEQYNRQRGNNSPFPLLSNYLLIALRRLKQKKLIASINVLGLTIGVAVSLLLGVYSYDIITYDRFHENSEDIYFLYRTRSTPEGGQMDVSDTWPMLAEEVQNAFPSVKNIGRFVFAGQTRIRYGDDEFTEEVTYSEQGMLDMFSFDFVLGDKSTAFQQPRSVVISGEVASRIFGDENPIGKTIQLQLNDPIDYEVTGVLDRVPFNSSFQFDVIVNLESRRQVWTDLGYFGWSASFMWSFIQLQPGQNYEELETQFPQIVKQFVTPSEQGTLELMPLVEYYDFNTNQQQYGYFLGYISIGLLLIAFFNFANLNTAQSLVRIKEVAIRKVFGAGKKDLILQFIGETTLLFSAGCLLGITLAFVLLPHFVDLFGQQMALNFLYEPLNASLIILIMIFLGIIAGLYPTFTLSRHGAGDAMHGNYSHSKNRFDPKNILIICQFTIAIILVSAVLIMYQQINYMKEADMKFDPDNLMIIDAQAGEDDQSRIDAFRNSLESLSGVVSVSATSSVPGRYRGSYVLVQSDDARDKPPLDWRFVDVDDKYFSSLEIEFIEGRDFDVQMASDERKSVINEAALRQLGWTSVEGRKLLFPDSDEGFDVIGVVKDFNYQSLVNTVEPVIHTFRGHNSPRYNMLAVKLNGSNLSETIGMIDDAWNEFEPNRPMEYTFLDETFKSLYETEERIGSMTFYATTIAIIVAILGILGLASFSVIERMKEMAIRKVLGASVRQLLMLLLKRTTLLLTIALVIAIPVNYFLMNDWLADFAHRIEVNFMVYVLATLIVMITSWLVLGTYALKSVKTNPSKTLRSE